MSIIDIVRDPVPGETISPSWARDVVRAIRACKVLAGPGMRVDYGPQGQRITSAAALPAVTGATVGRPWSVTLAGSGTSWTATFADCLIKRDSYTLNVGDGSGEIDYSMPVADAGEELYMGFEYNQVTGATEIISGATLGDVSESEPPAEVTLVKTPICVMRFSGSRWSEVKSLREIPSVGLGN